MILDEGINTEEEEIIEAEKVNRITKAFAYNNLTFAQTNHMKTTANNKVGLLK